MCAPLPAVKTRNRKPASGKRQAAKPGGTLDTLALLSPTRKGLRKRAKSKHFTQLIVTHRLALNTDSPLIDSYWNAWHCSNSIIQQGEKGEPGQKLTTTYCKNRWCMACNRIRTAKMINAYLPAFNQMAEPQFLTLTWPNVKADQIRESIEEKNNSFRKIYKQLYKKGQKIKGIKKIECTYNKERNDYHPHFHLVIDGKERAETILSNWLKLHPECSPDAQDLKPLDNGALLEMFKYFTDFTGKKKANEARTIYPAKVLDNIFRSVHRMQIFRPYGIKAIDENECIDEINGQTYADIEPDYALWKWDADTADWIMQETGEMLTGYTKSEEIEELFKPSNNAEHEQQEPQRETSNPNSRTRNGNAQIFSDRRRKNAARLREIPAGTMGNAFNWLHPPDR